MASRQMMPDRPVHEPVRLGGADHPGAASVREVIDRESRRKIAGEVQSVAEATQMFEAPGLDDELLEVPVGSWFG